LNLVGIEAGKRRKVDTNILAVGAGKERDLRFVGGKKKGPAWRRKSEKCSVGGAGWGGSE